MLDRFVMNGILWRVQKVGPSNDLLIDRTGLRTVATTDPRTYTVYISNDLEGGMLEKVIIHELGHCMMISYGLIDDIERMTKREYRIEAEEFICNLFADYGKMIFDTAYNLMGKDAIHIVPYEMDKLVS